MSLTARARPFALLVGHRIVGPAPPPPERSPAVVAGGPFCCPLSVHAAVAKQGHVAVRRAQEAGDDDRDAPQLPFDGVLCAGGHARGSETGRPRGEGEAGGWGWVGGYPSGGTGTHVCPLPTFPAWRWFHVATVTFPLGLNVFLFRTAPNDHQPPNAHRRQPPTANRHQPLTAIRQPPTPTNH